MWIASSAAARSAIGAVKVTMIGLATPTVDLFDGFTVSILKEAVLEAVSLTSAAACSSGAEVPDESTLPSGSASACGVIAKAARTVSVPITAVARMVVVLFTVAHAIGAYSSVAQRNKHEMNADSSLLDLVCA